MPPSLSLQQTQRNKVLSSQEPWMSAVKPLPALPAKPREEKKESSCKNSQPCKQTSPLPQAPHKHCCSTPQLISIYRPDSLLLYKIYTVELKQGFLLVFNLPGAPCEWRPCFPAWFTTVIVFLFLSTAQIFFFLESLVGIFNEGQRKTFSQICVKISFSAYFPMNSYRNTEGNHDISFYPTKTLAVFSTGYLQWKGTCFRYLFPAYTTSLKVGWAQIVTSALTFPHCCFKNSY